MGLGERELGAMKKRKRKGIRVKRIKLNHQNGMGLKCMIIVN